MFIQNFIKWNEGNECPTDYILWTAYGVLSLAIGPRVWYDAKQFFVDPKLYIILTGNSGNRKTFGMDRGVDILRQAFPDVILSGECESHQGILRFMDNPAQQRAFQHPGLGDKPNPYEFKYHPYGLFASELMDYLCINPISFVNFLTNIYDRKIYTYRLAANERKLVNPYLVMCSCTTDDWFTQQLNARTFGQGYGRRSIIVFAERYKRMIMFYNEEHEKARLACVDWLQQLPSVIGEMIVDSSLLAYYNKWYLSIQDVDDTFLNAWRGTKHILMWKVAILSSLSERLDRVITRQHIDLAIDLIDQVESRLPIITDRMGRSELIEPVNAVLLFIKQRGGFVAEKELQAKMLKHFKTTLEYFNIKNHLRMTDQIVVETFTLADGVPRVYVALPECVKMINKKKEPPK